MHRQLHDGLRDEVVRLALDRLARLDELAIRGLRSDDDAVAARRVGRLDDEAVEVAQHHAPHVGIAQDVRLHDRQQRLLVQVVAHDRRRVGEDRLVVGDARADPVRDRDVARADRGGDAGHAEQRVRAEHDRIEKVVVDAAVEDVDLLETVHRLHEDLVIDAHEVVSLDEVDAHLVRQEDVLEERRVVDAGREQGDLGSRLAARRQLAQALEQVGGIVLDAAHAARANEVGQQARHHDAVLDDVRNARRRAHVVLEHVEATVRAAHEVDARDGDERPVRRRHADGRAQVLRAPEHEVARHDAVLEDLACPVDVLDERVQRPHPLRQAGFEVRPRDGVDDARDRVEREDLLRAFLEAVDVEGDAHAQEHPVGAGAQLGELARVANEKIRDHARASRPRSQVGVEHLVEEPVHDAICVRNGHRVAHGLGIHVGPASSKGGCARAFECAERAPIVGSASDMPRSAGRARQLCGSGPPDSPGSSCRRPSAHQVTKLSIRPVRTGVRADGNDSEPGTAKS